MTEFVDTNVLLYAWNPEASHKQTISIELLERLSLDDNGAISIQVLMEFYATATRKYRMPDALIEQAISDFQRWQIHRPDYSSVIEAIHLHHRHKLHWFDAMILNSAIETGCEILWTEDFQDGQQFGNLVVRNPYRNSRVI